MLVSQAPPGTASRTVRSVLESWEKPAIPATEKPNGSPRLTTGTLTLPGVGSFVRRNGKRIGQLALILFTAGVVILSIIPARYAATALVLVDPREQHVTAEQEVLPGIGQDAAALQSLIEIAKSDGFLRPLIEKLKIADDDEIAGGEKNPSRLLEKFRNHLDISRRGLTYVIAMTFTSNSPQQAARYANAVADAFVANQTQAPHRRHRRGRKLAEQPAQNPERPGTRGRRRGRRIQGRAQDHQCGKGKHDAPASGN